MHVVCLVERQDAARYTSGVHLVYDVAELLEWTGERNELVQHELPGLVKIDHQRNVMVRSG